MGPAQVVPARPRRGLINPSCGQPQRGDMFVENRAWKTPSRSAAAYYHESITTICRRYAALLRLMLLLLQTYRRAAAVRNLG